MRARVPKHPCPLCTKKRKHVPYGAKKKSFWCSLCDAGHELVINKGGARRRAKKQIKEELRNETSNNRN